jgi:hypothetical protein
MNRKDNKHYDSNFIEEVIEHVGKSPTRWRINWHWDG